MNDPPNDCGLRSAAASIDGLIIGSPSLRWVAARMVRTVLSAGTLLISGETGVGKSVFAHAVGRLVANGSDGLVYVHCAATDVQRLRDIILHRTAEMRGDPGYPCSEADATALVLLLDGIDELSRSAQGIFVELLSGALRHDHIHKSVIATLSRPSPNDARHRWLTPELAEILALTAVELPALRERRTDIPVLAHEFLRRFISLRPSADPHLPVSFSPGAMRRLCSYRWPGNVQELANVVKQSLIFCPNPAFGVLEVAIGSESDAA